MTAKECPLRAAEARIAELELACGILEHANNIASPAHNLELRARLAELEQDRYHVWMRGFQAKVLGAAPSSNPFPEPPITVGPLPLPESK